MSIVATGLSGLIFISAIFRFLMPAAPAIIMAGISRMPWGGSAIGH